MSDSDRPKKAGGWSSRGLEGELALFLLLPLFTGLLAASFLPWPEGRWVIVGAVGLVTALFAWLWLRRTHVRRLELLARALETGHGPDRGTGPADEGGGFGELSGIAELVGASLHRHRQLERDLGELIALRAAIDDVTRVLGTWAETEQPPEIPAPAAGGPSDVARERAPRLLAALGRAADQVSARAREAWTVTGLVRDTVHDAVRRSEGVTAAAERQFVEATSLLTVLRELRRWGGELGAGLESRAAGQRSEAAAVEAAATAARGRGLLLEVETAAGAPLEAASATASRLAQAVAFHRTVEGEARIAAIEAAAASLVGVEHATELAQSLTTLTRDLVRAREQARGLERETEAGIVAAARELARLRALLAQAVAAFEEVRTAASGDAAVTTAAARRALDRMHEMMGEALARGEKLVQQAERTSSEALRAGDSMLGALDELDGLAARLEEPPPAEASQGDAGPAEEDPPRPLRVLGPADVIEDDEAHSRG